MPFKIIADSCCDITPELKRKLGIIMVPLTLLLGERAFTDDENLNIASFTAQMTACTEKIGSAAPSPELYSDAFEGGDAFAITLSSNLSGSHASALVGKQLAEERANKQIHVFDSKSACAGELLVALELKKMIDANNPFPRIVSSIESFISEMRTYFVLDNIDNLLKNGRLNRIVGTIISALGIKPVMGADKDGHIQMYTQARGHRQIVDRLADTIERSGKKTDGKSLVIAHCDNPGLAEKLMDAVRSRYNFSEIVVVPTRGVSTIYANVGGIVLAF